MIEIKEISSKKDLKTFINFPDKLYKGEKNYVPELKGEELSMLMPKTNFAFEYCDVKFFLCYKDNELAGRICAIVNKKSNELWKQKRVRISRIDFIDDLKVSGALFDAVQTWAVSLGLTEVQGPLGFTDFDKEGLLVEGFDRMGTSITIYNYPYYNEHFEAHGYAKETDWIEFRISVPQKGDKQVARISKLAEKVMDRSNVRFFPIKHMKDTKQIVPQIFSLINICYKDLYGMVPHSEQLANDYTRRFIPLLNPDYAKFIVDESDTLIAFGLAAPSLARAIQKSGGRMLPFGWAHLLRAVKFPHELDLLLVAVHPDYQNAGLPALLLNEISAAAMKNGIRYAESSPELETNHKVQDLWKSYNVEQHKRRRCYFKQF